MIKSHGMIGKQNAKKDVILGSRVFFRCLTSDKAKWVNCARTKDMKLTDLIIEQMNGICGKLLK